MVKSWHSAYIIERNYNRYKMDSTIAGWSDIIYMDTEGQFPIGSSVTFQLSDKKITLNQYKNKYCKASNCRLTVNRKLIQCHLFDSMNALEAMDIMSAFDAKNPEFVANEQVYVNQWIDHISENTNLTSLKLILSAVNTNFFSQQFIIKLESKGVPTKDALLLSHRLCTDHVTVLDDIVDEWLSRPYSPYLGSISLATRDKLISDTFDMNIRIRFLIHSILTLHENSTRNTYMTVHDITQQLKSDYGLDVDLTQLDCASDNYLPLSNCKKRFFRDPTLYIHNYIIQHNDVHIAEHGLVHYWLNTNHLTQIRSIQPLGMNELQIQAVQMVLSNQFSCITGKPGRGKTFVITRLCHLWAQIYGGNIKIVSAYHNPLNHLRECFNDFNGVKPVFKTIANAVYDHDDTALLIIEEAGVATLLDIYAIINNVLRQGHAHIVMIGDQHQLKPIGPGQPMTYFMKLFPEQVTVLTQSMRSSEPNINSNTDLAISGVSTFTTGSDFIWHSNIFKIKHDNKEQFYDRFLSSFDLNNDVIISHSNKDRKIFNLLLHNKHLETLINTPSRIQKLSCDNPTRFVIGTQLICSKTDPDDPRVTKGLRGVISKPNTVHTGQFYIDFNQEFWDYAYCLTAQGAHGEEFNHVFVYSYSDFFVNRDWVYTAISRGKHRVTYLVPNDQHHTIINRLPIESSSQIFNIVNELNSSNIN